MSNITYAQKLYQDSIHAESTGTERCNSGVILTALATAVNDWTKLHNMHRQKYANLKTLQPHKQFSI